MAARADADHDRAHSTSANVLRRAGVDVQISDAAGRRLHIRAAYSHTSSQCHYLSLILRRDGVSIDWERTPRLVSPSYTWKAYPILREAGARAGRLRQCESITISSRLGSAGLGGRRCCSPHQCCSRYDFGGLLEDFVRHFSLYIITRIAMSTCVYPQMCGVMEC